MSDARQRPLHEAIALHRAGRLGEATCAYRRLLAEDPSSPDVLNLLGVALAQAGPCEEAVTLIRRASELRPENPLVQRNLGNALSGMGRHAEALACYRRALASSPGDAMAHLGCGRTLLALGRPAEAVASCDAVLTLDGANVEALVNRARALAALGRYAEAEASLARAESLAPDDAQILYHRGTYLAQLAQPAQGLATLRRALALRPDDIATRWNTALLTLQAGRLREGWALYETRFERDALYGNTRRALAPRWSGREELLGRRILLWAERGLGDTLQFSRYVEQVRERGAEVILQVQARLRKFCSFQFPDVRVIDESEQAGGHDFQCPLLSLPGAFGTELESIPARIPYLKPDPDELARWAPRLRPRPGLRIGIAWQGNPDAEHNWARGRSIPVREFAPLAEQAGVSLVSLQAPPWHEQLASVSFGPRVLSFGAGLDEGGAFVDTAALMSSLDLVICCDTAIAHLAGGLGVPVWVALHATSEWRWLLERSDSPWYPTMRLYRQRRAGDWSAVFAEMLADLRKLAREPGAGLQRWLGQRLADQLRHAL
jgi:tetratricopeptide (TPR) repeat protein